MNIEVSLFGLILCLPFVLYDLFLGRIGVRTVYFAIWTLVNALLLSNILAFDSITWTAAFCFALAHLAVALGTSVGSRLGRRQETSSNSEVIPLPPGWAYLSFVLLSIALGAICCREFHGTINILHVAASDQLDRTALLLEAEEISTQGKWVSSALGLGTGFLRVATTLMALWALQRNKTQYPRSYAVAAFFTLIAILYYAMFLGAKAMIVINALQFLGVAILPRATALELDASAPSGSQFRRFAAFGLAMTAVIALAWQINYYLSTARDALIHTPIEATVLYVSGPTVAFSQYLDGEGGSHSGARGILAHTFPLIDRQLARLQGKPNLISPYKRFIYIPHYINVYTWLYEFYEDMGIAGVFLIPFVTCLVAGLAESGCRNHGTLTKYYFYGMLFTAIASSFFNWSLVVTGHFLCIGITWLMSRLPGQISQVPTHSA